MKFFNVFRSKPRAAVKTSESRPIPKALETPPADSACFHITHPKAGSQWMRGILEELFGPAVEPPKYYVGHVWSQPVRPGRVYPCVYTGQPEFESIQLEGKKQAFVLIRDLRDSLISAYFSMRNTHEVKTPETAYVREMLTRLNCEQGLLYLMETRIGNYARVQRTWLADGGTCYHLEDCMEDAPTMLGRMLADGWGVNVPAPLLAEVAARHSFARLSGGRRPGQENLRSHYRKGVAGDWKNHFTPAVIDRFKQLYNDVLIDAGYETSEDWCADTAPANLVGS